MKHKLFNDWGLKLGSVVLAVLIWFIVTNFNDPVVTFRVSNVKVKLLNTNVVTDQGQTFEVLDDTNVIDTVTVTGARSIIDALDAEDIIATADFNDLTLQNTVKINLTTNKYSSQIEGIRGSIDTLELNIEDLQSKTLALNTVTSGTVSDGYTVGEVDLDENQVRISGPESLIDQVIRAEVSIPVTGFNQDIVTDADIVLMNADGEVVKSDSISSNISKVRVKVELLQTKRVALTFETTGTPADGYEATGQITTTPETILVAGKASVLNHYDSIPIDEPINITGQTGDLLTLVELEDLLPSGIKLADATFDGKVSVVVYIDPTTSRTIQLNSKNIVWEDIPEGYKVESVDPEGVYPVVFEGLQKNLDKLDPNDIVATANLSGILDQEDTAGDNRHVVLTFTSRETVLKVSAPVQVWFKLIES